LFRPVQSYRLFYGIDLHVAEKSRMTHMPRVIAALLRHGDYLQLPETPSAWQPLPLTAKGIEQAERSVGLLRGTMKMLGWSLHSVVDSSCLLRGWQTAEVVCRSLERQEGVTMDVEQFEALAERGLGAANNLSLSQIEAVIKADPRYQALPADWKSNSHFQLPLQGAESLMQAGRRVASHLDNRLGELQQQVTRDTVKLFVGHGAAFRHAAHQLGVLDFEQIACLSMHHCRPVFLEREYAGSWIHLSGEWKVRAVDEPAID
jgi:2,3-bisphosphoglycerate-dependent phosphoglycerate mutase